MTAESAAAWRSRRLHFIGIGGAGMSGLAIACAELGAEVSGSDRAESSYVERLRAAGLDPAIGHDADLVPEGAEVVVSTAIAEDNPELQLARGRGQRVIHRGALLAELCAGQRLIAVAGTHGKTTTAAMCAFALREIGADPTFFLGGELPGAGPGGAPSNAGLGGGDWAVAEADESDGSFLELSPEIAVITNLELDHHARWSSLEQLRSAFGRFAEATEMVVRGEDVGEVEGPSGSAGARVLRFGIAAESRRPATGTRSPGPAGAAGLDLEAARIEASRQGITFGLRGLPGAAGPVEVALRVHGLHNVLNATAALGAIASAGLGIPIERAAVALEAFPGVARRLELKGECRGARVYDDYAHHPTEVTATLQAARELEPRRLLAVFQPHLYSRTRALAPEFGAALAAADEAAVLDVYPAREEPVGPLAGVTGRLVAEAAAERSGGRPVWWIPDLASAERALAPRLGPGDVLVTIGAGDVFKLADALVAHERVTGSAGTGLPR